MDNKENRDIKKQLDNIKIELLDKLRPSIGNTQNYNGRNRLLGFKNIDNILFKNGDIKRGDIIEVTGESGSGKSMFIMGIIIRTILPSSIHWETEIPLNCFDSKVILFDADLNFDITYFYNMTYNYIVKVLEKLEYSLDNRVEDIFKSKVVPSELINDIVKSSMQNLFIYTPTSIHEVIDDLCSLNSNSNQLSNTFPYTNDLAKNLIVVDSLTHFYWASKVGVTELAKNQYFSIQKDFINVLKPVLNSFNAFAVLSSWPLIQSKQNAASLVREDSKMSDSEINSSALSNALNYRLLLEATSNETGDDRSQISFKDKETLIEIQIIQPSSLYGNNIQLSIGAQGIF